MHWSDWVHVMTSTRGHWLPGDPRGFRSRAHRIHSSGDYRNPPPPGEHKGLHRHAENLSDRAIRLASSQIEAAGEAIVAKLGRMDVPLAALALDSVHLHVLMCAGNEDAVRLLGRAKQAASHALRAEIPGRIWGRSSHAVRIRSQAHGRQVKRYILDHAECGAWVYPSEPSIPQGEISDSASDFCRR